MKVLIKYVVAYLGKDNINFVRKDSTRPYKRFKEDEKQHTLRNIRYARNLCLCTLTYFHAEGDTSW